MSEPGADSPSALDPAAARALRVPIALEDGRLVLTRAIRADDAPRLQRFHERLSRQTIHFRFFGALPRLSDQQARRFAEVDYVDRFAIVAVDPDDPNELIGVVRLERVAGTSSAEMAIVIADRFQGQGLGRALTTLLVEAARERGIETLYAIVLPDNVRMIGLLRHLGYPYHEHQADGVERISLDVREA